MLYGTAYLREPYGPSSFSLYGFTDPQYRGDLRIPVEHLKNIFRTVHEHGWRMASHVTGDAGVDAVLDALEATDAAIPSPGPPLSPRSRLFRHQGNGRACRPARRMRRYAARLVLQGRRRSARCAGRRPLQQFIGLNVWREAGVKVAINSDHVYGFGPQTSFNPYDPFLTMSIAVMRERQKGDW